MTTIKLTPELLAPTDVRGPVANWLTRQGLHPQHMPATNAITITDATVTATCYVIDSAGYVLDAQGKRTVAGRTVALKSPFPPGLLREGTA